MCQQQIMSMRETRNVTFEEPGIIIKNKDDGMSRSRARSISWSRFRARRTKSQGARPPRESSWGSIRPGTKRDRSLANLVRTGSRNSVRSLVKLFETRSMSEGRKSQILLLDDRRLDIIIQPKLYSKELLDLVASHFRLKETQYFGLGFFDDTSHFNWLQGEKRVLDHEFPKKTGLLVLHFAVKFYVDTIGLLRDIQTVELFYLNSRQALFRGQLECDAETVFELAAHVLQATNGDFVSKEESKEDLKKLPLIPTSTLQEHPSLAYCEDRVTFYYEKLHGTSRGLAIVNYMTIVEKLPTYGIHYYDVKDKKDIPWWLGISPKGIAVYDKNDKTTPRKLFTWKNLENLYYRDKKFSIEVHGPKREESGSQIVHTLSTFNPYEDVVREAAASYDDLSSAISEPSTQVSVSRRTFGASNVDVHAWLASTPQLTKCIWSMAVVQHQFYLDRKQSRSQLVTARSMSEIAADLCRSTTSLPGSLGSDLSRSPSSHSLPSLSNSRYDLTIEQSDSLKAERDMYQALRARKEALEEALRKKTEELKLICFQEGELTGELPVDTPLGPGEQPPVFRRRVGTAFSLSVKNVQEGKQLSSELSKLELEVELQGKITSAACRLASDKTVSKYVRKQRRQSYTKAMGKLKDMEKKLNDMRQQMGKTSCSNDHYPSRAYEDRVSGNKSSSQASTGYPLDPAHDDHNPRSALSPSHSSPQLSAGYAPNGGVSGHRGHTYHPSTLGTRNCTDIDTSGESTSTLQLAANLRLDGSHDSGFSSANNMYNVSSQRTSHYESTDQLGSPATSEPGVIAPLHSQLAYQSGSRYASAKPGPGDEPFQRKPPGPTSSTLHYGSLDRKQRDYKQDIYRDVSPVRYKTRQHSDVGGSYDRDHTDFRIPKTYGDRVAQAGVIVEVPVHHERGQSMPPPASAKHAWGESPAPDHDRLKQGASGLSSASFTSEHCYSPRMYEGSSYRAYQDVDISHIHPKGHQDYGLASVHHTSSQPVFHRTERSISPLRTTQPSTPHPYQHHQRPAPPSGFDRPHIHYQQTVSSPTQSQHSPAAYYSDSPRTIPIQRIETLPCSSPIPQFSQGAYHGGSPASSGPSSPRGPTGHASSTLVTVTRLQPHTEVSKPYEMSDFYRYSEKLRRQRMLDHYQRQLIGAERMSRSSSPLSVESDSHSSQHSGSASSHSPTHQPLALSSSSSLKQTTRGPAQPYSRSASAPLSSMQPAFYQHHSQPMSPSSSHFSPTSPYPEGQISSSSSYTVKSHGPNMHYSMQSSSYQIQQVHSSTKHSLYQPPQPMTCKPVHSPALTQPQDQPR